MSGPVTRAREWESKNTDEWLPEIGRHTGKERAVDALIAEEYLHCGYLINAEVGDPFERS